MINPGDQANTLNRLPLNAPLAISLPNPINTRGGDILRVKKGQPGVIFLHSATGGPEDFIQERRELAAAGIPTISVAAPYCRSRNGGRLRGLLDPVQESGLWDQTCIELNDSWDFLIEAFRCAHDRIGFVGLNLGGAVGSFWLASHQGIRAAVVSGTVPELSEFWRYSSHPVAMQARSAPGARPDHYSKVMKDRDLIETLGITRAREVLIQTGIRDDWIMADSFARLETRLAGSHDRHRIERLDDNHEVMSSSAKKSRVEFLLQSLCR